MSETLLDHPRYRAREVLGRGALGRVVRVDDREDPTRALVAKIVEDTVSRPELVEAEFALLSRVRIPGLARVYDFARDRQGRPFLIEELIEGQSAAAWIGARSARLAELFADLVETLGALHDAGFVHADVKPEHIVVPASGRAVLLDLGAAVSLRAHAAAAFTPAYAAPEVVAGAAPTAAADWYSLAATLWAVALGRAPDASVAADVERKARHLRDRAAWITPSLAHAIALMLAPHPADRPRSALEILALIGRSGSGAGITSTRARVSIGRESAIEALLESTPGSPSVRYVVGPPGAGTSHVGREAVVRALLSGRSARALRLPETDAGLVVRLVSFLRGSGEWPFVETGTRSRPLLLLLDELEQGRSELAQAVDAFRCRAPSVETMVIVATARNAPSGAETVALGALDEAAFAALCIELGVTDPVAIAGHAARTRRMPGWLAADLGKVPLSSDAALERTRDLTSSAADLLGAVALAGGSVSWSTAERMTGSVAAASSAAAELARAGLVRRSADRALSLASPHLAGALIRAIIDAERIERVAAVALGEGKSSPRFLMAVAGADYPPSSRAKLLVECARAAARDGSRAEEIDALLALCAESRERTPARLLRLERLTRDAGKAGTHPRVLDWLDEAAATDPALRVLALRRRAEQTAREGRHAEARTLVDTALTLAQGAADLQAEAHVHGTIGALALYRGDWVEAATALLAARERLAHALAAQPERFDREEAARIDHNLGVVALYEGRAADAVVALSRSVELKRALGDRAGVRACLLNLGLALARSARLGEAATTLEEAMRLAKSLGQNGGLAWCLAARADVEIRQRRSHAAEKFVAEAEALGADVPATVRSDLTLLRAQIALLESDGAAAERELARLDPAWVEGDALTAARVRVLAASALLHRLPIDRPGAARAAIDAIRRARKSRLGDVERDAQEVLAAARARSGAPSASARRADAAEIAAGVSLSLRYDSNIMEADWSLIERLIGAPSREEAVLHVARAVRDESGGERCFVALVDSRDTVACAWGVDLDGVAVVDASTRCDHDAILTALRRGPVLYAREVETRGGRGSRLVATGTAVDTNAANDMRMVVVVEHRFVAGAFDRVHPDRAARWVTLAALAARIGANVDVVAGRTGLSPESRIEHADLTATAAPRAEARRVYPTILGDSAAIRRARALLDAAVDSDLPVLIRGETGTGKELFARALHDHGARAHGPFVAVNCAAITDSLFEAELFGHVRGAFTGAERARPGMIAQAEGGTLFLDEIGELAPSRQAALLRVLESRRYRAVGADDERAFDVRVVSATNRDLDARVAENAFRADLLYRIRVLEIVVPSLRARQGDVALLAKTLLARAGSSAKLSKSAFAVLERYPWPGNVRELAHLVQRLATLELEAVDARHLPRTFRAGVAATSNAEESGESDELAQFASRPLDEDAARRQVEAALAKTAGNISHAATLLGLTRHGLKKRMTRLGIRNRGVGS